MALDPGTRFGPYEVTGEIGTGGMGEVYRATDTKLGREVAIKTLPATLADDAGRLARFEREAKLLASLNHPHIAAVFSLDEHEGALYLAMELVEGETLEEKLNARALPVDDALRLALQVAEALEAAHGHGVIHRDLKPVNIMVTADGLVKVLDFGLAKSFSAPPGEASPVHSPALSPAMTQQGIVLGTAGYMSPEQASGQSTDQRTDVWAFGVVLYEMLTGLPLFRGESVPHIIADVLKTEPDWSRLPPHLHPRIRLLLERCLTKKPRSRLHSIADARIEIEAVLSAPEGVQPESRVASGESAKPGTLLRVGELAIVAAATVAIVGVGAGWFPDSEPAPEPAPVRFSVSLPAATALTATMAGLVTVSPDGARIVYAADRQLYLRNLDELEARPIQGTLGTGSIGAASPAFSPDGESLVYVNVPSADGPYTVKRVPVTGGTPQAIYTAADGLANFPQGITWPTPDAILFADAEGIVRLPANGGEAEVLVANKGGERFHSPELLPGGDAVLFTHAASAPGSLVGFDSAEIVVQSIGQDDRTVIRPGSAARFVPTGHIVYAEGTSLFAIPFDPATRSTRGSPVPLLDGLRRSSTRLTDTANYAVSATGELVYLVGGPQSRTAGGRIRTTLSWVDRAGTESPLGIRPDDYTMVRISPDGTKAALVVGAHYVRQFVPTIWIYDFATANLSLMTTEPADQDSPVWSADSRRLYFRAPDKDPRNFYDVDVIDLESGEVSVVTRGSGDGFPVPSPWSLSASGDVLAVVNTPSIGDSDVDLVTLPGGELAQGLDGEGRQFGPDFSADGAWLAYADTAPNADAQIVMVPWPEFSRTKVPVVPGEQAVFSQDGSELFFFDGGGIAAVDLDFAPSLRIGPPHRLFATTDFMPAVSGRGWDPDPSGQRFLMIREPASSASAEDSEPEPAKIEVVLHWFEDLKRRAPAGESR